MSAVATLLPVFFMLGLGLVSRLAGWVTPEQKAGANDILFGVLFPLLVFNMMSKADLGLGVLPVVGYVSIMYILAMVVVGPFASAFTGLERAHLSKYLLATHEGGNVALPLYLSIVAGSTNTVIFDLAGTFVTFVVVPILVARDAAASTSVAELVRKMVTNPFIIAVTAGLVLNLTGLRALIVASGFGPAWTATLDMATSPIVGLILFCLGYDLTVDKGMLGAILRLAVVRLLWSAAIIAGFFLLFASRMAERDFLIAVLVYFTCPTGFGMVPLLPPVFKSEDDAGFVSAFMSLYIVVTLVAYTLVVLFLA